LSTTIGEWSEPTLVKHQEMDKGYLSSHPMEKKTLSKFIIMGLSYLLVHVYFCPDLFSSLK
jgi:hypothetical protein